MVLGRPVPTGVEISYTRKAPGSGARSGSQTLERGLQILELLSRNSSGLLVAELAEQSQLDRAIVYRLLNTLEARGLAARDGRGCYFIGLRVIDLARTAFGSLQSVAAPVLTGLAESTGATATITVAEGNEAVLLSSVEPPNSALYLAYRPGFRHALDRSAFGMAILSARSAQPSERPEVAIARSRGYAVSFGEVMPGGIGIAAPIVLRDAAPNACIGVAIVNGELDEEVVAPLVIAASKQLSSMLIRPS